MLNLAGYSFEFTVNIECALKLRALNFINVQCMCCALCPVLYTPISNVAALVQTLNKTRLAHGHEFAQMAFNRAVLWQWLHISAHVLALA